MQIFRQRPAFSQVLRKQCNVKLSAAELDQQCGLSKQCKRVILALSSYVIRARRPLGPVKRQDEPNEKACCGVGYAPCVQAYATHRLGS